MRTFFLMSIALAGCGSWGGEEDQLKSHGCKIVSAESADPSVATLDLSPANDLLADVEGEFPISAVDNDGEGPYAGVVTVARRDADIIAQDLERAGTTHDDCRDRYLVPVELGIAMDDGVFTIEGDGWLEVREDPFIAETFNYEPYRSEIPFSEVEENGTLDLIPHADLGPPFDTADTVLPYVRFEGGVVSGCADVKGDKWGACALMWGDY